MLCESAVGGINAVLLPPMVGGAGEGHMGSATAIGSCLKGSEDSNKGWLVLVLALALALALVRTGVTHDCSGS